MNDALGMSDELISEQAYLIARGVRPMMLFHLIDADPLLMGQVAGRIEQRAEGMKVLPFVFEDPSGMAWVGYAASKWVFETFQWAVESLEEPYHSRVLGMLLGYNALEVAKYEEQQPIRGFKDAVRLRFLRSTQQKHGVDRLETNRLSESPSRCTHNSAHSIPSFGTYRPIDPW